MAKTKKAAAKKTTSLPHVSMAVICEQVLIEKDDVASVIRIIDRVRIPIEVIADFEAKDLGDAAILNHILLIGFKSGDAVGDFTVDVDIVTPRGRTTRLNHLTITLLGQESGANIRGVLPIFTKEEGLHWYNISVNGTLVTRVPLFVEHLKNDHKNTPETDPSIKPKDKNRH